MPFQVRQFVWCQFPYLEEPLRPGPKEHVAYVADIRQLNGKAHLTVMAIYTTTTPWRAGARLPLGVIPIESEIAMKMQQKSFVMDARKIAFIPVDQTFFPRLRATDKGIIHTASERFHSHVQNTLMQLAKRPELVIKLGPDLPPGGHRNSKPVEPEV
jgi:hypothetical protein